MDDDIGCVQSELPREAEILDAQNPEHIKRAAEIIMNGDGDGGSAVVVLPFVSIYGLFGPVYSVRSVEKILAAKNRPGEKKLIIFALFTRLV